MNTLAPSFFDSIILILAGNEDMHESLEEFKFWPDTTTNSRVEKLMYNVVNTLAPTFSIESHSFFSGNEEILLKVWTEFEFDADRTKGWGASCP